MTENFLNSSAAYKADIDDTWSYAFIYDQPYGADVFYPVNGYIFGGSNADFNSNALTGILQYNTGNGTSFFGGLRAQSIEAEAEIAFASYTVSGEKKWELGYLAGVAYEKPEIALRVALTYISEITYDLDTLETSALGANASTTEVKTPQAVNLEFQSGIAEDTLVFGSVRWVEWSEFDLTPASYLGITSDSLVSYDDDTISYTLGVGRRFNEQWSGAFTVGYEEGTGGISSNLGPTDGYTSVGLGGTYTEGNMKITGGVTYAWVGDATTSLGTFEDNTAMGMGFKVGFSM